MRRDFIFLVTAFYFLKIKGEFAQFSASGVQKAEGYITPLRTQRCTVTETINLPRI